MKNITLIFALVSIINISCNSDDCMGMSKEDVTEHYQRLISLAIENEDQRQASALRSEFLTRLEQACD